jgi:hypothetical protein
MVMIVKEFGWGIMEDTEQNEGREVNGYYINKNMSYRRLVNDGVLRPGHHLVREHSTLPFGVRSALCKQTNGRSLGASGMLSFQFLVLPLFGRPLFGNGAHLIKQAARR